VAEKNGETFDSLTSSCIEHALRDSGEQDHASLCILAFVLQMNSDYPGRFVDLLDIATDFKFDIVDGDGGFNVHARVRGKLHS
jgi:hypothetical protein